MSTADVVWDLLIVGAGPTGCAAAARALQLRPSARVLLVDKAAFPRDKCCGDGVAGAAIDLLCELGLSSSRIVDGYPPMNQFRVRSPGGVDVSRNMPDPVWVIPRMVFDARLLGEVVRRGARFRRHTARRLEVRSDRVVVDGTLQARVVIGADGAESVVRRSLGYHANPPGSLAVAIRGYGPELAGQDGAQLITMTPQHWPAYAWSFPTGAGRANLGYGQLLRDGQPTRAELLARLRHLLPGAEPDPATLRAHRLPMSTSRPVIRSGRILLAGDAQSLINPLTGEGIYYALVSGRLAGDAALHGERAGAIYRAALRRALGRYLRHASTLAWLSRWPALMDSVLRGASADQSTFDDLVRLGLQDGVLTRRLLAAALTPGNWLKHLPGIQPVP